MRMYCKYRKFGCTRRKAWCQEFSTLSATTLASGPESLERFGYSEFTSPYKLRMLVLMFVDEGTYWELVLGATWRERLYVHGRLEQCDGRWIRKSARSFGSSGLVIITPVIPALFNELGQRTSLRNGTNEFTCILPWYFKVNLKWRLLVVLRSPQKFFLPPKLLRVIYICLKVFAHSVGCLLWSTLQLRSTA